jgi:peptidoglycan/LPS O-acetylase OafA/YrhL
MLNTGADLAELQAQQPSPHKSAGLEPAGLYEAFKKVRTFASLDGLRAFSILGVMWHHTRDSNTPLTSRLWLTNFGYLYVDLFFTVSGFLIVTLLLRQRDKNASFSLPNFYARRGLRIFPLYYAILGVFTLYYLPRDTVNATQFKSDLPYLLVYLTNWHHAAGMFHITWTLSTEEQFYLLWPPVERFLSRWVAPILVVLTAITQILHFGLVDPLLKAWLGWDSDYPAMLRHTTFMPIIFGVLLAHLLHDRSSYIKLAPWLAHRWTLPLALVTMFIAPQFFPSDMRGFPRLLMQSIMFVVIGSTVIREDHKMRGVLAFPPLARIGVLSYGLYLLHHFGNSIVEKGLQRLGFESMPFVPFVGGFCVSYVLAELSYRFFETPFLKLKERFP